MIETFLSTGSNITLDGDYDELIEMFINDLKTLSIKDSVSDNLITLNKLHIVYIQNLVK